MTEESLDGVRSTTSAEVNGAANIEFGALEKSFELMSRHSQRAPLATSSKESSLGLL
jgi:hypothetical protein